MSGILFSLFFWHTGSYFYATKKLQKAWCRVSIIGERDILKNVRQTPRRKEVLKILVIEYVRRKGNCANSSSKFIKLKIKEILIKNY
jgi:hypothetical protein